MAEINRKLRNAWIKGMETIGSTASGIASNARYRVDEMNLMNRRRELLSSIAAETLTLYKQGERFPEQIMQLLQSIDEVDEMVRTMRAEHIERVTPAGVKEEAEAQTDEALAAQLGNLEKQVDDLLDTVQQPADEAARSIDSVIQEAIECFDDTDYQPKE